MTPEGFREALSAKGLLLSHEQMHQFAEYVTLLREWNEQMNLTAITDPAEIYVKHFYDSLTLAFYQPLTDQRLCDVGSGAGFPSIPLKILFPNLAVTIVDLLNKRITFLNHLCQHLGLKNVACYHMRAEEFGKKPEFRQQFDVVTARAVARLSVLSELCLPLVRVSGQFVALKAATTETELAASQKAIKILGGAYRTTHVLTLPEQAGERQLVVVDKVTNTPTRYPRKAGIINKNPLQ